MFLGGLKRWILPENGLKICHNLPGSKSPVKNSYSEITHFQPMFHFWVKGTLESKNLVSKRENFGGHVFT